MMVRLLKEILIIISAIFALIYLMLPSILPDFIPIVGWMDEGAATLTLVNTLKYYGLDLTNLYGTRGKTKVVRRVRRKPQSVERMDAGYDYDDGPIKYED